MFNIPGSDNDSYNSNENDTVHHDGSDDKSVDDADGGDNNKTDDGVVT